MYHEDVRKTGKHEKEVTEMIDNETIERLSRKHKRWTKYGFDRIYFESSDYLEFDNDRIWFNGNPVSKTAASRLASEKTYLDLNTGKLVIGELMDQYFGDQIRAEIE
jgi:hypothetical protein